MTASQSPVEIALHDTMVHKDSTVPSSPVVEEPKGRSLSPSAPPPPSQLPGSPRRTWSHNDMPAESPVSFGRHISPDTRFSRTPSQPSEDFRRPGYDYAKDSRIRTESEHSPQR
ncbi:hypothetical protein BGZ81_005399 [Podila clonocystis]|nr:hypothetical protein BGZ81_005399 [Podila clonocystis]